MTNKIEITRELAEHLLHCGRTSSFITPNMTAELRALLATPVVERQPKGAILRFREYVGKGQGGRDLWHDWTEWSTGTVEYAKSKLEQVKDLTNVQFEAEWLYTAPPELAELQATIARLTAENERLKGGQGEPAYWADDFGNTIGAKHRAHNLSLGGAPAMVVERFVVPLYASQPAPVSVVDEQQAFANWTHQVIAEVNHNGAIQRVQRRDHMSFSDEKVALDAWSARACLDKVKELNRIHLTDLEPAQRLALARGEKL